MIKKEGSRRQCPTFLTPAAGDRQTQEMPVLARYALFCLGCALVQLARLTSSAHSRRFLTVAAILSLAAEAVIGFGMFRWWVAIVVAASVTVVTDVAALRLRAGTLLILGGFACAIGALSLSGLF